MAHIKNHTPRLSRIHQWDARMAYHTQIKNIIHYISKMKDKIMIILINAEKASEKI